MTRPPGGNLPAVLFWGLKKDASGGQRAIALCDPFHVGVCAVGSASRLGAKGPLFKAAAQPGEWSFSLDWQTKSGTPAPSRGGPPTFRLVLYSAELRAGDNSVAACRKSATLSHPEGLPRHKTIREAVQNSSLPSNTTSQPTHQPRPIKGLQRAMALCPPEASSIFPLAQSPPKHPIPCQTNSRSHSPS